MPQCFRCGVDLINPFFCRECQELQTYDNLPDFFQTLNIPQVFNLDLDRIESNYEDFLMDVHPDFFPSECEQSRSTSLKYSSHLKTARDNLLVPFERTLHLLSVKFGKKPTEQEMMPSQDFLLEVFAIQEQIESEDFDDETVLEILERIERVLVNINQFFQTEDAINDETKCQEVLQLLGQLKFLQNLKEKVEQN